jgi:hypothetical protein
MKKNRMSKRIFSILTKVRWTEGWNKVPARCRWASKFNHYRFQ